jgi:hypothetical protein
MLTANTKTTTMQPKLKTASLCLSLLLAFTTKAQVNLVPNPSFETYTLCPDNMSGQGGGDSDQLSRALGWAGYSQTPDYFNKCSSNTVVSTPNNMAGYQQPHTGNSYAGLASFPAPQYIDSP